MGKGGLGVAGKAILLLCLVTQNAANVLTIRYSRGVLKEDWNPGIVLLCAEVLKFAFAMVVTLRQRGKQSVQGKLLQIAEHCGPMLVPAFIFWAQQLLSFVALERISGMVYSVCAQMKIFTTALCSVALLRRHYSWTQWRAMLLLCIGTVLVADFVKRGKDDTAASQGDEASRNADMVRWMVGLGAVLAQVSLSGFAGVYFERVLKSKNKAMSIWDRNVQLAGFSVILYSAKIMYGNRGHAVEVLQEGELSNSWYDKMTPLSLVVVPMTASGGLLVAFTVKHTDTVIKSLATGSVIAVTTVVETSFMQAPLGFENVLGASLVVLALLNFTYAPKAADAPLLPSKT